MDGDWRDAFALVYEAAARLGFRPKDCDEMEIWELASALGANRADDEDTDRRVADSGRSWNARRAYALEHGLPEPSWDDEPPSAAEVAAQRRMMEQFAPMLPPDEGAPS